jgi:hypothetical protein
VLGINGTENRVKVTRVLQIPRPIVRQVFRKPTYRSRPGRKSPMNRDRRVAATRQSQQGIVLPESRGKVLRARLVAGVRSAPFYMDCGVAASARLRIARSHMRRIRELPG